MPTAEEHSGSRGAPLWSLAVWSLAAICVFNVGLFTWWAAIPLPASDAWYFLAEFLSKALQGDIGVADLFLQRSLGVDHAQPLQKLVLLGHLHVADLDFRIEAMVGVVAAVATCGLLARELLHGAGAPLERERAALGAMALLLVGLSLNAVGIYTWSLVTLGWIVVLVMVLYWRSLSATPAALAPAFLWGVVATMLMGLVLDELAIPVVIALLMARALGDPRGACSSRAVALAVGIFAGLVGARLIIQQLSPVPQVAGPSLAEALAVVNQWRDLLLLVGGPLANAVVHASHHPQGASWWPWIALAVVSALGHVAFWWRVLVSRRLPSMRVRVVAIAMMLTFYATVAGILLVRAPLFGVLYLHQPRYALFYQLSVLAWVLLFAAPRDAAVESPARVGASIWPSRAAAMLALLLLVSLQGWLSSRAWSFLPYQRAYVADAAEVLALLAETNEVPEKGCPDILTVCQSAPEVRAQALGLLKSHKLNLFSARFRARHRWELPLRPEPVAAGVHLPSCERAVVNWGPRIIRLGERFNVQADGQSAYWIKVHPVGLVESVSVAGQAVSFTTSDGVISFLHDAQTQQRVEKDLPIELRLVCTDGTTALMTIPVVRE